VAHAEWPRVRIAEAIRFLTRQFSGFDTGDLDESANGQVFLQPTLETLGGIKSPDNDMTTIQNKTTNPTTPPVPSSPLEIESGQRNGVGITSVPPVKPRPPLTLSGDATVTPAPTNTPLLSTASPTLCSTSGPAKKKRTEQGKRKKWTTEDNIRLMEHYFKSNPARKGFRKRLHASWMDTEDTEYPEQRLADQARSILH
jgi:hypothetical protein